MRKILVVLTMTICSLGIAQASRAGDRQAKQTEMQHTVAASQVAKNDCSGKTKHDKKRKNQKNQMKNNNQEDSLAPQNVIELRGGG
jgi:hypothetical protein